MADGEQKPQTRAWRATTDPPRIKRLNVIPTFVPHRRRARSDAPHAWTFCSRNMKHSLPTRLVLWLFPLLAVPVCGLVAIRNVSAGPMAIFGPVAAAIVILIVVFGIDRFLSTGRSLAYFVAAVFFVGMFVTTQSQSSRPMSSFPPEATRAYIRGYWNAWKYGLAYCLLGVGSIPLSRYVDRKRLGRRHPRH